MGDPLCLFSSFYLLFDPKTTTTTTITTTDQSLRGVETAREKRRKLIKNGKVWYYVKRMGYFVLILRLYIRWYIRVFRCYLRCGLRFSSRCFFYMKRCNNIMIAITE